MRATILGLAVLAAVPAYAQAENEGQQILLRADKGPLYQAWESPATLAYTRNGDGTSNSLVDLYLQYTIAGPARKKQAQNSEADATTRGTQVTQATWGVAAYLHRDNAGAAPRNDRGLALTYGRDLVPDYANEGGVIGLHFNLRASFGKTLQGVKDDAGLETFLERDNDRQIALFSGYFQPGTSGPARGPARRRPLDSYFNWEAGLYSDHSSGGDGKANGRRSGSHVGVSWNFFPLGLVPTETIIRGYGVTPVITLSAQRQKDARGSGGRPKDTYKLYVATLTLEFNALAAGDTWLTPSLNLSRSVGADLLQGRAYEGKTEFSFGLKF